mgnify:CR=1 FL=1|jgi:hypothetical protein
MEQSLECGQRTRKSFHEGATYLTLYVSKFGLMFSSEDKKSEGMSMKVDRTKVLDVLAVIPQRFGDERGFFCESYSKRRFEEIGLSFDFV